MLENLPKIYDEILADDSADEAEQLLLYSFIRSTKPKTIVETGTHRGRTTLIMAEAIKDEGIEAHIHTADPYPWGQEENFAKFPELSKNITFHNIPGKDIHVEQIDFLFIDGFHEKAEVIAEWEALSPKLSENAIVIFHDCDYPGNKLCDPNGAIEELKIPTIWVPTKNKMRIFAKGHL